MLLLAAAAAAALPATAQAASYSVPAALPDHYAGSPGAGSEGPRLADGQVLWAERHGSSGVLLAARAGEPARELFRFPALAARRGVLTSQLLTLAAGPGTAVAGRHVFTCRGSGRRCEDAGRWSPPELHAVDLATGAARGLDPGRCTRASDLDFDLAGSVLALDRGWCGGAVRDLVDGAESRFEGRVVAAAGMYAVVVTEDDAFLWPRVRLVDWRSGRVLRRLSMIRLLLDDAERQITVDADGTVAYVFDGARVVSPGARRAHSVGRPGDGELVVDQVRLAGGLLARRRVTRWELGEDRQELWVGAVDGSGTRRVYGQRSAGGWDFDGTHLTWAAQPCAQVVVQVWDLAAERPARAPENCGLPTLGKAPVVLRRGRALPIEVTCPPQPAQGCAGDLLARLHRSGGGAPLAESYFTEVRLRAGQTRTVPLGIAVGRRRIASARRLHARVEYHSRAPGGGLSRVRLTVG